MTTPDSFFRWSNHHGLTLEGSYDTVFQGRERNEKTRLRGRIRSTGIRVHPMEIGSNFLSTITNVIEVSLEAR
jgi:hypothetical protein